MKDTLYVSYTFIYMIYMSDFCPLCLLGLKARPFHLTLWIPPKPNFGTLHLQTPSGVAQYRSASATRVQRATRVGSDDRSLSGTRTYRYSDMDGGFFYCT